MKHLNLTTNPIGDSGAIYMSTCLYNIEELSLSNCNITKSGVEALCDNGNLLKVS